MGFSGCCKMDDNGVIFKGTVNGLTIIMREEDKFEDILEQMEKKIVTAGKFFKGSSLAIKYRGKKLSKSEEEKILDLLVRKSGAEIKSIEEDMEIKKFYYFKGINEGITKFYKGTVRSGQLVSYNGNLVVIGDVNPGGVVEATGNVIVLGSLRGIVHAGSDGNKEAFVVALNLQPTQLRIADVITRSPDEKGLKNQMIPEMAIIKDETVYIERVTKSI